MSAIAYIYINYISFSKFPKLACLWSVSEVILHYILKLPRFQNILFVHQNLTTTKRDFLITTLDCKSSQPLTLFTFLSKSPSRKITGTVQVPPQDAG